MSKKSNYHTGRTRDHCYFCGAYGGIEEHHVIPQRFNGPDKPENVVGVCSSCHKKIERLYDKGFYQWFGIDDEQGKRRFHTRCPMEGCANRVTQHWRNTRHNVDVHTCGEHERDDRLEERDRFTLISEADQ